MIELILIKSLISLLGFYGANENINRTFNTIQQLKLNTGKYNGELVFVEGYYKAGDGGDGSFRWDSNSVISDDGGTVIEPVKKGRGRWLSIMSKAEWSPKKFGAKANDPNFDCSYTIQQFTNVLARRGIKRLKLGDSFYVRHLRLTELHNGIEFGFGTLLKFEKRGTGTNNEMILVKGNKETVREIRIKEMTIKGFASYTPNLQSADDLSNKKNGQWANGISFAGTKQSRVIDCSIEDSYIEGMGKAAISIDSGEEILIKNCSISKCSGHGVVASIRYGGFGAIGSWPQNFNPSIIIDSLFVSNSRTVFDFAGTQQNSVIPNHTTRPAKALVKNVVAQRIDGRTKIDGWWSCELSNLKFQNEWKDNKEGYSAISLAASYMPPISISNMEVIGYTSAINGSPSLASIKIDGLSCTNCLYGIVTGINCNVSNFSFVNGFAPIYGSSTTRINAELSINKFTFNILRKNKFVVFKENNKEYWKSVSVSSNPITTNKFKKVHLSNGIISDFGEDSGKSFGYLHSSNDSGAGVYTYQNLFFKTPAKYKPAALFRIGGGKELLIDNINDSEGCTTDFSIIVEKAVKYKTVNNSLLDIRSLQ